MKTEKSSSDLEAEVIFRDMCAHCGTCGAFCPHIKYNDEGVPVVQDACNETLGLCYNSCPRASLNVSELETKMFGKTREDDVLGVYSEIISVKASKGSILNALLKSAMKKNNIDGVIVPDPQKRTKKPVNNVPQVVTDSAKIPELSGMNLQYTGPLNPGVNTAAEMGLKNVCLVGNPCHIQGITKNYYSDFTTNAKVLGLKIGLMCASGGASGCKYCIDYSAEFSDISYSETGQEKGTAVLVIRTEVGKAVVDAALKSKAISKVSDKPDLEKIKKFGNNKRKKNVVTILKKDLANLGYLKLGQKELTYYFG